MEVAAEFGCLTFLSHAACQDASTRIWNGAIEPHARVWKVRLIINYNHYEIKIFTKIKKF